MSVILGSSFRDPTGYVFCEDGIIYRKINIREDYNHLMKSGLYDALENLLIRHQENNSIIKPEQIPFISYPYEWCFSQLKDAALLTLEIQKKSLNYGMSLKDCSAYNIQFINNRPIFIDTLSFEKYKETPWVAYRQFCQHFLAPLSLMSYKDIRLNKLLQIYIDGIPLDLASSLLPFHTRFIFPLLTHIHLHAKAQNYFKSKVNKGMSKLSLMGLIDSLETVIRKLKWWKNTEWGDYYKDTNYSKEGLEHKKKIVFDFLKKVDCKTIWDFGSNTEDFGQTVSFDIDPVVVEKNYSYGNKLTLLVDLANPSPAIGWENEERMSLIERGPTDTLLALAFIHHLVITNGIPFCRIADFFRKICRSLIIEFVPKDDSQIQRLTKDIHYTQEEFEKEFKRVFVIENSVRIKDSKRTIYLMK